MSTRKAPPSEGANEEGPNKRRRRQVVIETTESTFTLSLTSLNDNCLVRMLSNLTFQDLNNFAMCNRHCRELRRHESLDQTRSGTIIVRGENRTIRSLLGAIVNNEWNNVFTGNRTHLKIEGFERFLPREDFTETLLIQAKLPAVNSLDLSQNPLNGERAASDDALVFLTRILPNLREANLSYVKTVRGVNSGVVSQFAAHCPHLGRLSWKGADGNIDFDGSCFHRLSNLTDLCIDNASVLPRDRPDFWFGDGGWNSGPIPFLGLCPPNFERVSIKGVTVKEDREADLERQPLPQETIIHFVRDCHSLRWLRSDLTEENVAMLKQERPEITFVS